MRWNASSEIPRWAICVTAGMTLFCSAACGGTETVLYSFQGGADGANPVGNLIADNAGNLYGATTGGDSVAGGVVFQFSAAGIESVIYAFESTAVGENPNCGLLRLNNGDIFGTTFYGGASEHYGTVFKLTGSGKETVLHSFVNGSDGAFPHDGLVRDKAGNLYGTTEEGGRFGWGTVFKVTPAGIETVVHTFTASEGSTIDGASPAGGLLIDTSGNLFGTTQRGGASGKGVVFEIAPNGTETILYSFSGPDGASPTSNVIKDKAGNFFGTTTAGGAHGLGTVFKLSPGGTETVLHSFAGLADGQTPFAGVVEDAHGNLFGVVYIGGTATAGAVFEVTAKGVESVVYSFLGGADGMWPYGNLLIGPDRLLYGMTSEGGAYGKGTIFRVKP